MSLFCTPAMEQILVRMRLAIDDAESICMRSRAYIPEKNVGSEKIVQGSTSSASYPDWDAACPSDSEHAMKMKENIKMEALNRSSSCHDTILSSCNQDKLQISQRSFSPSFPGTPKHKSAPEETFVPAWRRKTKSELCRIQNRKKGGICCFGCDYSI